jgi:hypothetical protein
MTLRWPSLAELRIAVPIALPLLVLSIFVFKGCNTASVPLLHPPPGVTLPAAAATSAPADLTGVQLAGVEGTTTPDSVRGSGTAHLSGSVSGPQGPVPGATVRVEHLVDDKPPPIDVSTGPDGRWDLPNVAGGRYRVRSFLAPTLAQTQPEIFFLTDGEQRTLDLAVESFVTVAVAAAIAPDPPQLNEPVTLVVRVARKTVDAGGIVQSQPIVNAGVALTNTQGWSVRGQSSSVTDGNGDAAFTLDCRASGAAQVQVAVRPTPSDPPQSATLSLTPCADANATSTTPTTAPGGNSEPPPSSSGAAPN